jgi:thiamine pyrophosphokinase
MGKIATLVLRDVPYHIHGDVFGVEQGALALMRDGVPMQMALGDFDSIRADQYQELQKQVPVIERFNSVKDQSDSELAIFELMRRAYKTVHVYGALGARLDHQHINLQLCYRFPGVILYDEFNRIQTYPVGEYTIERKIYTYLSFFTYETALISLLNMAYPLHKYELRFDELKTVSNRFIEEQASFIVHRGKVMVYRSRE